MKCLNCWALSEHTDQARDGLQKRYIVLNKNIAQKAVELVYLRSIIEFRIGMFRIPSKESMNQCIDTLAKFVQRTLAILVF